MTYKEIITALQILPPVAVPIEVYPEREGTYGGSRYYSTAQDEAKIQSLTGYLALLNKWKGIALSSRGNADLQRLSNDICNGLGTSYRKTQAIHRWVFYNINYTQTSSLIPPDELVKRRAGDCKSFSVLIATLLGIQGIPSWFKLVQLKGMEARHIYNFTYTSWFAVDGTGYFCFSEVKRVIGYMLFEVDKTVSLPPKPLPSPVEADEAPPVIWVEELAEIVPILGIAGLIFLMMSKK